MTPSELLKRANEALADGSLARCLDIEPQYAARLVDAVAIVARTQEAKVAERTYAEDALRGVKAAIDTAINDLLCETKPSYDDSIVGINDAWDVVRRVCVSYIASASVARRMVELLDQMPQPVGVVMIDPLSKVVAAPWRDENGILAAEAAERATLQAYPELHGSKLLNSQAVWSEKMGTYVCPTKAAGGSCLYPDCSCNLTEADKQAAELRASPYIDVAAHKAARDEIVSELEAVMRRFGH